MKSKIFVLLLLISLLVIGCTTRIADLSIVSTKNVMPNEKYEMVSKNVIGEDIKPIVIFIPIGVANMEDAIEDALNKGNGDLMTNAVMYSKIWYIPYVFGEFGYSVKGDIWRRVEKSNDRAKTDTIQSQNQTIY